MYREAENSYKKAIEINSKFDRAFIALGNLQTEMENYDEGLNTFNAVLAFDDKSAKANFGVGNVYYKQKKYSQAIPYLQKAVEVDTDYDHAYNVLGLCLMQENQLSEAAEAFNKAIESTRRNSRKGSYYYRLGGIQAKLKRYKEAEQAYLNALKFSKSQNILGGANFGLGETYKNLGQTQKALEYFRKASRNRTWKASADYEIDMILNPDKYAY
jgi:tetratricopeptide (TPR) repeat protein